MLVEATNMYAKQKNSGFSTSSDELRLFFAMLFTTRCNPLPRRRLYWENTDDVKNVAISGAMARTRFDELMRYIHIADNDNLPIGDKFSKVRP